MSPRSPSSIRQHFGKPVVIDMFCYRRHGHNEADEPAFTQPLMYARIRQHPSVVEVYANAADRGRTADPRRGRRACRRASAPISKRSSAAERRLSPQPRRLARRQMVGHRPCRGRRPPRRDRRRSRRCSRRSAARSRHFPKSFTPHKTIARIMAARRKMIDDGRRHRLVDRRGAGLTARCWSRAFASGCPARIRSAAPSPSAMPC